MPTTKPTGEERRHTEVSEKLATDLDRFFASYRSADKRELTEGEVMTAISRLIVRKCKTEQRAKEWTTNIGVGALALYAIVKGQDT